MRFGLLTLADAEGAVLAHAVRLPGLMLAKGRVLTAADLERLAAAGATEVVVARLEAGDVPEDEAARRIAAALEGPGVIARPPATGRVNLHAAQGGVLAIDTAAVDALNAIDEAITLATLPAYDLVEAGAMVATVKIIPFAVAETRVAAAVAIATRAEGPVLAVRVLIPHAAGLIQTVLPGTKPSVLEKTRAVMAARLEALGSRLAAERRCPHEAGALAEVIRALRAEGCAPVLIVGASAITDRRDVIPAAIEAVGGRIDHFGMPVDPGNLLLLARDGAGTPMIGLPGCARSPKLNGIDWVLRRLLAGIAVAGRDIMRMGVGGLLLEATERPQPREAAPGRADAPRLAAVVLAAGRSSRMGGPNKLLAPVGDRPMVAHAVDAALGAGLSPVVVVVGHQAAEVRAALAGRAVVFVENPDYAAGLGGSLRRGIEALPPEVAGAAIFLGDMPGVGAALIRRLAAGFDPAAGRAICVPVHGGRRGNPVLFARRFFPEMVAIQGDVGARGVIGAHAEWVAEVEADEGALLDLDTPEALRAYTE